MSIVTRFWWIRHAAMPPGIGIPHRERRTAPVDPGQLSAIARLLPPDAQWLSSDLLRARETCEAIRATFHAAAPISIEPAFDEQDFGSWTGRHWDELWADDDARRFWAAPATTRPPGGESFSDLAARLAPAVHLLASGGDRVIVAHAGSIRAAVALALGLAPENALRLVIDPCSLTRLDHIASPSGSAWRVVWVNRPSFCQAEAASAKVD